jgi:hypothetical protein
MMRSLTRCLSAQAGPALTTADLGMARGLRADIVIPDSCVVVTDSDLSKIPEVFELARNHARGWPESLLGFPLQHRGYHPRCHRPG